MITDHKGTAPRVLLLITTPKLAEKASEMYSGSAVPEQYQLHAFGTASSEILDLLGLGNIDWVLLVGMMPKAIADEMLLKMRILLKLDTVNSGIAFTVPISGGNNMILRLLDQMVADHEPKIERKDDLIMIDMKYALVAAIVNQGFSEEAMTAARAAGARGGTVLHSRQIVSENAVKLWGVSMQEEKDILMILTKVESKLAIMQAISECCGTQSEAQGIVLSLPIDSIVGLNEF